MERIDALRALKAKVIEGREAKPSDFLILSEIEEGMSVLAAQAHLGSIDAARALHDSVISGWLFTVTENAVRVDETGGDGAHVLALHKTCRGEAEDPARAWLVAILSALITRET